METEKGQKYLCPVVEVYKSNGALFYVVNANGHLCTVKAFEYQKGRATPSALQCIVRGSTESGEPIVMQDIAAALQLLYKVGETYEFKVKSEGAVMGYYEVVDRNGFVMRLTEFGDAHFYVNQVVNARVTSINQVRVELALVTTARHEGLLFLSPERVLALAGENSQMPQRYMKLLFDHSALLKEAREHYEAGNAMWLITAIDAVDRQLADWLNSPQRRKMALLGDFRNICINTLEMSDYLADCTPDERDGYQKRIGTAIRHADDYLQAMTLLRDGNYQTYVDDCLHRLRHTGYLYQPETKMRVLMSLFTLRQESVQGFIEDIFAVIRDGQQREQFMQQFKGAFIEMLDIYIWHERRTVDLLTSTDDEASRLAIEHMTEALAIQLLLVDQEECDDYMLYRSMLYRCASLLMPGQADVLLQFSYHALFSGLANPLEYKWEDVAHLQVLCSKLSAGSGIVMASEPLHYHGSNASLVVAQKAISITPLQQKGELSRAYPDEVTPWQHLQVLLPVRLKNRVKADDRAFEHYQAMWQELEQTLLSTPQAVAEQQGAPRERVKPNVGDTVTLRVLRQVPGRKYDLYCQIEDDRYMGIGILDTHKVVHYNVEANPNLFRDMDTGEPLLLRASVEDYDDDGVMHFTMLRQIAEFINQDLVANDVVLAMVTLTTPSSYICITDLGFSLAINRSDNRNLKFGDYVLAEITKWELNGNVYAHYLEKSNERFDTDRAFQQLVSAYADGHVYIDPELDAPTIAGDELEDTLEGGYLEADAVEELIRIVDRLAMTRSEQLATYNYLAAARLLSLVVGNQELADYYAKRIDMLLVLQQFADHDSITDEQLHQLLADSQTLADHYPEVKNKLQQLQIINCLGKKEWHDEALWQQAADTSNQKTSALAQFVLSYNMLQQFNFYDQLQAIKRRIYQTMDLEMPLPKTSFVAHEDQFTELKSSMIYPAGNSMQANERAQMHELLIVVCSFLNAKGGTLYVGVNNLGMASGLDADFVYLNNRKSDYDIDIIKDRFDLHFRQAVHDNLGVLANDLVSAAFINVGGKWVYRVEVEASSELVYLEKQAFVRQGTSKWLIPADQVQAFARQRSQRRARTK